MMFLIKTLMDKLIYFLNIKFYKLDKYLITQNKNL